MQLILHLIELLPLLLLLLILRILLLLLLLELLELLLLQQPRLPLLPLLMLLQHLPCHPRVLLARINKVWMQHRVPTMLLLPSPPLLLFLLLKRTLRRKTAKAVPAGLRHSLGCAHRVCGLLTSCKFQRAGDAVGNTTATAFPPDGWRERMIQRLRGKSALSALNRLRHQSQRQSEQGGLLATCLLLRRPS